MNWASSGERSVLAKALIVGVVVVFASTGCSRDTASPAIASEAAVASVGEESIDYDLPGSASDPFKQLELLRADVEESGDDRWQIAVSPLTWSTLTITSDTEFTHGLVTRAMDAWRSPTSPAFVILTSSELRQSLAKAAADERESRVEFDSHGWRISAFVQKKAGDGGSFIRISFQGIRISDPLPDDEASQ